ncbi:MAG: AraC family transcriptional regulator N-terminal domain-containing protein [Ignavibacteriota bacterium]
MTKNTHNSGPGAADAAQALNRELASKVARLIGSAEKQATAVPRLTLHQRTAPTPACHVTYEPCVIVVPQGRKEVQIGADAPDIRFVPVICSPRSICRPSPAWQRQARLSPASPSHSSSRSRLCASS